MENEFKLSCIFKSISLYNYIIFHNLVIKPTKVPDNLIPEISGKFNYFSLIDKLYYNFFFMKYKQGEKVTSSIRTESALPDENNNIHFSNKEYKFDDIDKAKDKIAVYLEYKKEKDLKQNVYTKVKSKTSNKHYYVIGLNDINISDDLEKNFNIVDNISLTINIRLRKEFGHGRTRNLADFSRLFNNSKNKVEQTPKKEQDIKNGIKKEDEGASNQNKNSKEDNQNENENKNKKIDKQIENKKDNSDFQNENKNWEKNKKEIGKEDINNKKVNDDAHKNENLETGIQNEENKSLVINNQNDNKILEAGNQSEENINIEKNNQNGNRNEGKNRIEDNKNVKANIKNENKNLEKKNKTENKNEEANNKQEKIKKENKKEEVEKKIEGNYKETKDKEKKEENKNEVDKNETENN